MANNTKMPQVKAGASEETLALQTQGSYVESIRNQYAPSTRIYVSHKRVGDVIGDAFVKTLDSRKHFLRKPCRSIAFDVSSLQDARTAGASRVVIYDSFKRIVYLSTLDQIWAKGFEINRGFGEQIALALKYWHRPGEQVAEQLSLFGGQHD